MTFTITTAIYQPRNPLMATEAPRPNLHSTEVAERQVKGGRDGSMSKDASHARVMICVPSQEVL